MMPWAERLFSGSVTPGAIRLQIDPWISVRDEIGNDLPRQRPERHSKVLMPERVQDIVRPGGESKHGQ